MPVAEPRLCLRCSPHEDSALCVAFSATDPSLLASGGEDGALLLHDIRTLTSSTSASTSSTTSSTSSSSSSSKTTFEDPVAALSWQSEHALCVGSGKRVHFVDVRKISSSSSPSFPVIFEAEDDVSSLSVARDAKTLAVADDAGAVTLVDLSGADRSSFSSRKLPSAHGGSVATACCFRPNRSGESLVSAGCDCTLARWDCSGRRLVRRWQAASELVVPQQQQQQEQQGEGEGEELEQSTNRMFNPPFVHSLAVPTPLSSFASNSRKPWNALVAAAIGDGSVVVLEGDASSAPASSSSSPADARSRSSRRRERDNAKKKSSRLPPRPPFGGVLAVLGRRDGGHSSAATCVAFVDQEKGSETDAAASPPPRPPPPPALLASGGNDGRVLFWRWAEKAAAVAAAAAAAAAAESPSSGLLLPPSWSSALAPFRRDGGGGNNADDGGGAFPFLAAATRRGAKLQALDSRRGIVAAADTSEVVKLYRLE